MMGTAYGLQEVLNKVFRSGPRPPKTPTSGMDERALSASPLPREGESALKRYLVKVARTSAIYVYLGMWTINLMWVAPNGPDPKRPGR
jgi:hypothetical protein